MSDIDLEWLERELATCDDPVHVHEAVPGLIAQIRRQNANLEKARKVLADSADLVRNADYGDGASLLGMLEDLHGILEQSPEAAPMDWSPEAITKRTEALVAALDGFELVERMPDGSWAARVARVHFSHLVAAGGHVDRYVFGDGVGWSEVKLELAGDVRVALHCELIDSKPAAT